MVLVVRISNAQFQFVSPLPGSTNLPLAHNIILRQGNLINAVSINTSLFTIEGSKSGIHAFRFVLCDDGKTINLNPEKEFANSEAVTVSIAGGAFSLKDGEVIAPYSFTFTTIPQLTTAQRVNESNADSLLLAQESSQWPTADDTVNYSRDMAGMFTINTNTTPSPGDIFFDCRPVVWIPINGPGLSLNIIDNSGDSIFQRMYGYLPYDFKMGKNGYFDTYRYEFQHFDVLDSNFNVIDTFSVTNGFAGDPHELTMLANGYAFLTGLEDQPLNNITGQIIRGSVIQEFDPHHHVVFEWRSFDHVDISEALSISPLLNILDYVHTNSIEADTDGNIITSHRHLDQINKIDVNTGEFIWRLGGLMNEFTFINDSDRFYHQHDCRRIANGNITLYDNGNINVPDRSFAKEYRLDEVNKTATLVWSYGHPDVDSAVTGYMGMGSVQRLPNGNTFIGWGLRTKTALPSITEVDSNGNIVWEITMAADKKYVNYRAHKYVWNPCARPSFNFMRAIQVTKYYATLIWEAVANPSQQYEIEYKKHDDAEWIDRKVSSADCYLNISNLDSATLYDWRIQSWCDTVAGTGSHFTQTKTFSTPGQDIAANDFITIYPNPVNDAVTINCAYIIYRIRVLNLLGQQICDVALSGEANEQWIQLSVSGYAPGNYFVEVTTDVQREVRRLVVVR